MEFDDLRGWVGRSEQGVDQLRAAPVLALAATLDQGEVEALPGSNLPPLWHWLYFQPLAPASALGDDGHARRGGFLPPVPLPRRMWAGSRVSFHRPLRIDDEVTRVSRIASVNVKNGRSGPLVFVCVRHEITNALGLAITEEQDIVYRGHPPPDAPAAVPEPPPFTAEFSRQVTPDPVLLFRYSALTFNGHRIHYDRPYATGVEGYPGLVVHGPLIATLLLEQFRRRHPQAVVRRFSFKAVRPIFDTHSFEACGRSTPGGDAPAFDLWARDHEGALAMQAQAVLA